MSTDPFRGTVNYDIGSKGDRSDIIAYKLLQFLAYYRSRNFNEHVPPAPKVMSTINGNTCSCEILTISGIREILYLGFPMLSTQIALVFSSIAAANDSCLSSRTNLTPIPKFFKNTLN